MENNVEEILNLVKKKMSEQGAYSRDAFKQFTEESIDYYVSKGAISDDDNLEFIEDRVIGMYEIVKEEFSEEI